jgi:hypothetical protein
MADAMTTIALELSTAELASVERAAAAHGLTVPAYALRMVLGGKLTKPKAAAPADAKRGTRIDLAFAPTPELIEWARTNAPSIDLRDETETFVNYWAAVPGARGVKTEWARTWQNWVKRAHATKVDRGWRPTRPKPASVTTLTPAQIKARWLADHGTTEAEYEANKHDPDWVARVSRRGKVA